MKNKTYGKYEIIEYKSCASSSSSLSDATLGSTNQNDDNRPRGGDYALSREDFASTAELGFPKLFHEQRNESETSIVSLPDYQGYPLNFGTCDDDLIHGEDTVYRKVANWVMLQRKFFRQVELPLEDDELEVIDPVDLFHESVLDDYQLITENESERRILLRDFDSHRYHIQSIEEAMQIHDYKFLRKPTPGIEMELTPLINFHLLHKERGSKLTKNKKRRKNSEDSEKSIVEQGEETLNFLGVPRLLENYVILNREGYSVKPDDETDLWLSPLKEDLIIEDQHEEEFALDFISSWFSDVFQSDINTDEVRTLVTLNTDIFEKVTVITVGSDEEDVWVDAPDIPHWLDDEQQELELFNQPSRPLYYYRDRIKGCYRIIGVEDETVVLFSGNDDDTIFYPGDNPYIEPPAQMFQNRKISRPNRKISPTNNNSNNKTLFRRRTSTDRRNDSGIEDVEDSVPDDITIPPLSLSTEEAKILGYNTQQIITKTVTFFKKPREYLVVEYTIVLLATLLIFIGCLLKNENKKLGLWEPIQYEYLDIFW